MRRLCQYGSPENPCDRVASVTFAGCIYCALCALLVVGDEPVDVLGIGSLVPGRRLT